MAKFIDRCHVCGREYTNCDEPLAYRRWCSIGCEAKAVLDDDQDETPPSDKEPH